MQKTFVMPAKMFRYHTFLRCWQLQKCFVMPAKMFRYHYCICIPRIPKTFENKGFYPVACASSDRLLREPDDY